MRTIESELHSSPQWTPPKKDHGGQDLPEYFALNICDSFISSIWISHQHSNERIFEGAGEISNKIKEITEKLKNSHKFEYNNTSIFMVMKIMLDRAYQKIGIQNGENDPQKAINTGFKIVKQRFTKDMTTEKALDVARDFVNSWDWRE